MRIGNVDGYTYNTQFQKTKQADNGFQKSVAEAENGKVSKENMTLEEYKAYFNEKMDGLYTHPSQKNMNWVIDITDDAYKRMQTDPAYEQKILDALATNKAVNFGNNIPVIAYTHVDDTWEGCYGYTKGMKENNDWGVSSSKKEKSDKKKIEKEDDKKALAEYLEKRRQEQKLMQKMRTKEYFEHKEQQAYWNKRQSAVASYEANIVTAE